jgi:hypothetical protein
MVGNTHGALIDGASLPSAPRYFGLGAAWSIAGSASNAAIATASGKDPVYDTGLSTVQETIDFSSGKVALSSDGSILGALAYNNDSQYLPDRTLDFYSLPSENVISSFPSTFPSGDFDFTLSASGTTIGQEAGDNPTTRRVSSIAGGTSIWSDSGNNQTSIFLSPDGTLIAVSTGSELPNCVTEIILNGAQVAAVSGVAVGWIDNNRLLVQTYARAGGFSTYMGSTIYSAAGVVLSTPALPDVYNNLASPGSIQTVTSDTVYDPKSNSIYSLTTGQAVWTGSLPGAAGSGVGAVAGPNIVYESGNLVVAEPY